MCHCFSKRFFRQLGRWKQESKFIDSRVTEMSRPVGLKESDNKAAV